MALTDTKIRNIKATDKPQKFYDERGLFLLVTSVGKYWRFKYHFNDKEKLLALGVYPAMSLSEARTKRDAARDQLDHGVDPSQHRKAMKVAKAERKAHSFEAIAREWYLSHVAEWAPTHSATVIRRLERDVFPPLGHIAIREITAPMLLQALRAVEARGTRETARRILGICSQIFKYAIATARLERNVAFDLEGAISAPKKGHFSAPTDPQQLSGLLKVIEGYQGSIIIRCALRLLPHVFVRPGELRTAKWADIDLTQAEWRFTVTKTDTPHIVPLSRQSIAILQEIQPITGTGLYVFPCARTPQRPMSDNAILGALRRLGITKEEATGHGFRATARTLLDEVLKFRPDYIEQQLAHTVRDPNGRAYNRTAHLEERKQMMQAWSDFLDALKQN